MPPLKIQVRTWIATLNGADEESRLFVMDGARLVTSGVVKFICGQLGVGNRGASASPVHGPNWSAPRRLSHPHGYMQ